MMMHAPNGCAAHDILHACAGGTGGASESGRWGCSLSIMNSWPPPPPTPTEFLWPTHLSCPSVLIRLHGQRPQWHHYSDHYESSTPRSDQYTIVCCLKPSIFFLTTHDTATTPEKRPSQYNRQQAKNKQQHNKLHYRTT